MKPDGDIHIQAGRLRHRVTINQPAESTSPPTFNAGGPILDWITFKTNVPAQIGPARSTDVLRSGQVVTQTITPITIRYLPGVLADMQVYFPVTGSTYVIQGILNIDERNIVMELECILLGDQN